MLIVANGPSLTIESPDGLLAIAWICLGCGVVLVALALIFEWTYQHGQRRDSWRRRIAVWSAVLCIPAFVLAQRAYATYIPIRATVPKPTWDGDPVYVAWSQKLADANSVLSTLTFVIVMCTLLLLGIGALNAWIESGSG